MDSLEEVSGFISICQACSLHKSRDRTVPGTGSKDSLVMFIGEGPGYWEDKRGKPFVGPSGNLLEELLSSIGLNRDSVFLTNMIKCRTPNNRDPQANEIISCSKFLDRQIELINPKVIVTLGRFSTNKFIPGAKITQVRGQVFEKDNRYILPIIHPAAALRSPSMLPKIQTDFKKILSLMNKPRPLKEIFEQQKFF